MSEVEPFLKLLDATVKASRLSGTKTKQLSQDSLKIPAAYDTKLVSSFLKLNNSLKPASQQRISSLYVFDAIARANKGQKGREGFMEKMEGVVDSWVRGMLTDGNGEAWAEGREKMRKVLDIWTKGTTFPRECLDELERQLAAASAPGPEPVHESTTPPFSPALPPLELKKEGSNGGLTNGQGTNTTGSSSITSPPPAVGQLPPEIQKLLGIQASQQHQPNGSASPATATSGSVDLASILATLKPGTSTQTPPQGAAASSTPTIPHAPITGGAGIAAIDPAQLAALANLTKAAPPVSASHTQQHNVVPPPNVLAGILGGSRPSPPTGTYGGNASPAAGPGPAYGSQPHPSHPPGGFPPFPPQPQSGGPSQYAPAHGDAAGSGSHDHRPRSPPRRGSAEEQWRGHGRQASFDGRDGFGGRQRSRSPPMRRGPTDAWSSDRGYGETRDGPDWGRGEREERNSDRGRGRGGGGGGGPGRGGRGGYSDRGQGAESQGGEFPRDNGYGARAVPPRPDLEQRSSGDRPGPYSHAPQPPSQQPGSAGSGRAPLPIQPGKDEFGRDLPPNHNASLNPRSAAAHISPQNASASLPPLPPSVPQPPVLHPNPAAGMTPRRPAPATTSFRPPHPARAKPTLETFDIKTFDPNQPASWAALAEAWEGTNGRQPNPQELMEWLMMAHMRGAMGGGGAGGMGGGAMGQMGGMGGFGGMGGGMAMGMGGAGGPGGMGTGGQGGPQGQGGYGGGYQ